jgi:hypothetical protein
VAFTVKQTWFHHTELPFGSNRFIIIFYSAHGDHEIFMESHEIPGRTSRSLDLSDRDYRIASEEHDFGIWIAELNRRNICSGKHVANPGCVAGTVSIWAFYRLQSI